MELDEIKIWFRQQVDADSSLRDAAALESAVHRKTSSVIRGLKKNMLMEAAAILLCTILSAGICISRPSIIVYCFGIATWIYSILFLGYLYTLYQKIIYYETVPASIKEKLRQLIHIITGFIRLYFRISIALLPVIFVVGLFAGYLDISQSGLSQQFHWTRSLLFYILFFAGWSVFIYFFAGWYIRKLYGNYLAELKQQLADMENG